MRQCNIRLLLGPSVSQPIQHTFRTWTSSVFLWREPLWILAEESNNAFQTMSIPHWGSQCSNYSGFSKRFTWNFDSTCIEVGYWVANEVYQARVYSSILLFSMMRSVPWMSRIEGPSHSRLLDSKLTWILGICAWVYLPALRSFSPQVTWHCILICHDLPCNRIQNVPNIMATPDKLPRQWETGNFR